MVVSVFLASRSPRRRVLLEQLGVSYQTVDINIEETWDGKESARDYVTRLARTKAVTGLVKVKGRDAPVVLAADTVVVLDDRILGKARGKKDALAMLAALSGRTHQVYTAVALAGATQAVRLSLSRVSLCPLSQAQCLAYWETGEPIGKAGGYAIQGRAAAFINRIEGSYSGVVGLPLCETAELLRRAGALPHR